MKNFAKILILFGFLFMFDENNQEVFRIEFDDHRIEKHEDKGIILIDSENPKLKPGSTEFIRGYNLPVNSKGQGEIQDFVLYIQVEKKD